MIYILTTTCIKHIYYHYWCIISMQAKADVFWSGLSDLELILTPFYTAWQFYFLTMHFNFNVFLFLLLKM